jgi:hypothetical protein
MRGLKTQASARLFSSGHAFVQNLRRGHYELAVAVPPKGRLVQVFAERGLRQGERKAAVGQRDRSEPVAQLHRPRCRLGPDLGQHLERVQCRARLALVGAEVRLEASAVAAVPVPVGVDRSKRAVAVTVTRISSKRRRSSWRACMAMNEAAAARSIRMGSFHHAPRSPSRKNRSSDSRTGRQSNVSACEKVSARS